MVSGVFVNWGADTEVDTCGPEDEIKHAQARHNTAQACMNNAAPPRAFGNCRLAYHHHCRQRGPCSLLGSPKRWDGAEADLKAVAHTRTP